MKHPDIKNIVVPIDFSRLSIQAIHSAKRFASRFDATVHLIHVHEFYYPAGFGAVPQALPAAVPDWPITLAQQMGKRLLQELKELATTSGLSPGNCHLRHGAPVFDEICLFVREIGADLIVTPTHGYSGFKHVFLGSTAERLVQHSPCPVLVTREEKALRPGGASISGIDRILVPVDFSRCSLDGLRYAIELAEKLVAKITVLHVVDFGPAFTADGYAMYDLSRYKQIAREEAEREMTRFLEPVAFGGVKYETKVVSDLFLDAINGAIKDQDVDLIVTATHGRTGLKHVLIGSTAELVVRRAASPVLVVPSHPEERTKNLVGTTRRLQPAIQAPATPKPVVAQRPETERFTKHFRKIMKHPFPERRKTNKFRESHQQVSG